MRKGKKCRISLNLLSLTVDYFCLIVIPIIFECVSLRNVRLKELCACFQACTLHAWRDLMVPQSSYLLCKYQLVIYDPKSTCDERSVYLIVLGIL